ncbi:MAG: hypothetical protein AAGB30_11260 [Pedobacter sp.]|nr:hypothetical protein [Pedobacter sp.]
MKNNKDKEHPQNQDFEHTGISVMKMKLNFTIRQSDMEKDLIKKTEGSFLKPEHFNENPN